MDYVTTKTITEKRGIADRWVRQHRNDGRIEGAVKMGNTWLILKDAEKPEYGRYKNNFKIRA